MARPRTPAKILDLRGAFKKHPERKRKDPEGKKPLETDPPTHLDQSVVPAWRYIVERLPLITVYDCDEVAIEMAARCLAGIWKLGELGALHPNFKPLNDALRSWLSKLGMTPADRTKIPMTVPRPANSPREVSNPFEKLKTEEKDSR